ncbi:Ty3/gypsy retrotransposon protein, partial [Trifolium medium]|nr:Ty3/gypsy retrotransposon protein [Trifolium medium]
MADTTPVIKELQENIQRNADAIDSIQSEMQREFRRAEAANAERFNLMHEALDALMQKKTTTESYHGGLNSGRSSFQVRSVKLDFPRFDGKDVLNWIFKAEQFFDYHNTPDEDRLMISSVHLDHDVVPWFQMIQRSHPFRSWQEFTRALEMDFGPSAYDCPRAALFKLNQTNSVAEYYKEFNALANRVYGISNEAFLDCFLSGLNGDIRRDVIALEPASLPKAFALAKLFEEKYSYQTKSKYNPSPYKGPNYSNPYQTKNNPPNKPDPTQNTNNQKNNLPPLLPTPNHKPLTVRNISPAEMQLRRDKGLCYFCDEKFSHTHRCPNRRLMMLQLADEEVESIDPDPSEEVTETVSEDIQHHLSLNAMKGNCGMGTLRFTGTIDNIQVQVLVDSGSSDTYLQPRIAQFLKIPIEATPSFQVLVGNGETLTVEGMVRELQLQVQGHELSIPAYLLPVAGADLILGSSWLATLGPHIADYAALTLQFYQNGQFIKLQGDRKNTPLQAQFHQLKRMHHTNAIDECFTIQMIPPIVPHDILSGLPVDMEPELAILLHTYQKVFQTPSGLPPPREQMHEIPLQEGTPFVKVRPYRYPHSQKEQIEKMVQEMLQQGIIKPSNSPFSSPIILVKKKDGSWRFCTDYRALNQVTIKDSFPMPTVDELLDELFGANYFSKLDLRSGYHQILVNPADCHKTAFRTHHGHYEWLVMPFGLTNAPATFQCLMNKVFQSALRKFVLVFFDDILVYSQSWHSHLEHLEWVLQVLQTHELYAKLSKCSFGQKEVDYLGHIVSGSGVKMDANKINDVLQWPVPKNIKQLRGFLGLTGYYRRFIKAYAQMAGPLTDLLRKDAFVWSPEAELAFNQLKKAITTAPVLKLPDFTKPFILETDASGTGVGAVLGQQGNPIAYFSKKLSPRRQKQSAYIRELLAITEALAKFRHYLLGHKFIIKTDQKSLKSLLDQSLQTPEQQAWLHKFIGFDFQIEYKPGKENIPADALSRMYMLSWSEAKPQFLQALSTALQTDNEMLNIMKACQQQEEEYKLYSVRDGLLLWKDKLVIPNKPELINQILTEFHTSHIGGHAGITRTIARIQAQFFWKNMRDDIKNFVQQCIICQQAKAVHTKPAGLLQPLPIPTQVWEDIAMDFITGLPNSFGFTVIMVVIDRLTKYSHFVPQKTDYTSKSVAEAFMTNIAKLHGIPKSIVSDRDKVFTSGFWQHLFKLQGTTLAMSTSYHPQTDGQSEILNKCLEMYLRCFTFQQPKTWCKVLALAEYWYNTAFHTSAGMTPFQALYGREPPAMVRYVAQPADLVNVKDHLLQRDAIIEQLRNNLLRAQQVMKHHADKKRTDVEFNVGDKVLVKLQPYRQHSASLRKNQKLSMRYFGPFNILARVGKVAYKLELPPSAKIHPVFHVAQLKPFKGSQDEPYIPLPLTTSEMGPTFLPNKVLDTRMIMQGSAKVPQVLIQWGSEVDADTKWEDFEDIKHNYPDFNLEDK